jgi:hypothetical protein
MTKVIDPRDIYHLMVVTEGMISAGKTLTGGDLG